MPLTRIKSSAIGTDAITSARIDDGAVATVDIADQAVTLAKLEHGTSSNNGKFLRANNGADPSYETVNTDLVSDTTPQLGGALDAQTNNITNVGRVGIGTASPSYALHSSTTTGSDYAGFFHNGAGSGNGTALVAKGGANNSGAGTFIVQDYGGNEDFKVDGLGRVTKPNNISFMARGGNDNYINTNPIPFPTVTGLGAHNIGGHYNNSNYTFTAPIAGRYFLHVHLGLCRINGSGSNCYPYIRINGSNTLYSYFHTGASGYNYTNNNMSGVFELAANDAITVHFFNSSGTYYNGSSECRFSGYLMG